MDFYSAVSYSMPDKLDAYYDDPGTETFQMPELEEMENLENESHEDSPLPAKRNLRRSARSKKKRRKRSSSVESEKECEEEGETIAPMSNINKEIMVGEEYQAVVPESLEEYPEGHEDPDEQIWKCPDMFDEDELRKFVDEANLRYRTPIDRALYVLTVEGFNCQNAIDIIAQRNDLRDIWSDDEVNMFYNSFFMFGKNFKRIRTMMPHRSLTSIIQFYYDSKKRITYKKFLETKADETSTSIGDSEDGDEKKKKEKEEKDEEKEIEEEPESHDDDVFANMCENCGERCEQMEIVENANTVKPRSECKACRIYYEIMDAPRPTSLRLVLSERLKSHYNIPEYMKKFMKDYDILTHPATGKTYQKRFMGDKQKLTDIVGVSYKGRKVKEEDVEMKEENDDKSLKDEEMEMDVVEKPEKESPKIAIGDPTQFVGESQLPTIWKKKHTICMEEIEVIADDARKRMFEACVASSTVNKREVSYWRSDMNAIRHRIERTQQDIDLTPSYLETRMERDPPPVTEWNERDQAGAMKLFNWYGTQFAHIATILANKTPEQVQEFYNVNKDYIDQQMAEHQSELSQKVKKIDEDNKRNNIPCFFDW